MEDTAPGTLPKYNLRFYWPLPAKANKAMKKYMPIVYSVLVEHMRYSSNRNKMKGSVRVNFRTRSFHLKRASANLTVIMVDDPQRRHRCQLYVERAPQKLKPERVVVDTNGRAKFLARRLALTKSNTIPACLGVFLWVKGWVNIEN